MSDLSGPPTGPTPAGRGTRWRVGTVVAALGLLGFVVLGLVILVGVLRDAHFVDLFPWMFGSLAVGVLGMVLAGAPSRAEIDQEETEEAEGPDDARG